MTVAKTKVKAAWRGNLLRHLRSNGAATLTSTCRLLKVGQSKVSQECRRDPEFHKELEEVLGHEVDVTRAQVW